MSEDTNDQAPSMLDALSGSTPAPAPDVSNANPDMPTPPVASSNDAAAQDSSASPSAYADMSKSVDMAARPSPPAAPAVPITADVTDLSEPKTDSTGAPSFWRTLLTGALSGLQGIPESKRPGFISGLGSGARAQANAAQLAKENAREDLKSEDLSKMRQAQSTLLQMEVDRQHDNLAKSSQDNIRSNWIQQRDMEESQNNHAQVDGLTEEQAKAQIGPLVQAAHDSNASPFSFAIWPSLKDPTKWAIYKKTTGTLNADYPYQMHNPDGTNGPVHTFRQGEDLTTVHSAIDNDTQRQLTYGIEKKKSDLAIEAKNKEAINQQNTPQGQATLEETKATTADKQADAAKKKADASKAGKPVVAWDPDADSISGEKGANVVMSTSDARDKGLFSYPADPAKINATIAGFNDAQVKLNRVADVVHRQDFGTVQAGLAAALLDSKGISVGFSGVHIPFERINAGMYAENLAKANQATRDYVVATIAAHEALTQLPRLQTFGQSSRVTQSQMEAAQRMLPDPADDAKMAGQKIDALQEVMDPLRKQLPLMPGAKLMPSYRERTGQTSTQTGTQSTQGQGQGQGGGKFDPTKLPKAN